MRRVDGRRLFGIRERDRRTVLRFERGDARSRIFLGLQMRFGACDRRLRGIEIRGRALRGSGDACRGDRLARIAHLLHRGSAAAGEADEEQQKV